MPWCYVTANYSGPGREFVKLSEDYPERFYVPCELYDDQLPPSGKSTVFQAVDENCTCISSTLTFREAFDGKARICKCPGGKEACLSVCLDLTVFICHVFALCFVYVLDVGVGTATERL